MTGIQHASSGTGLAEPSAAQGVDQMPRAGTLEDSERYLTFTVGGQAFALPLMDITEIIEYRPLTMIPRMPGFIRGVINIRGKAVPVLDVAARFGIGTIEAGRRTSIIIVERGHGRDISGRERTPTRIGLLVDAVNAVSDFGPQDLEPSPRFGDGIHADYISGMARNDGSFIITLDVDHVLPLKDVTALEETVPGT